MKNQKFANQLLADNPGENAVHITEDGQAFFNELAAKNHAKRSKFGNPEVFFREGFEPEDTKELEENLQLLQEDNALMTNVLEHVIDAADLEKEAVEVNNNSHPAVIAVVTLREKHLEVQSELEDTKAELATTLEELSNIKANTTEVVVEEVTATENQPKKTK